MSDKLKVVGAKALLDRPVLRVVRGDECASSPPTIPDPSWEVDQMDLLDAYGDLFFDKCVIFPPVVSIDEHVENEDDAIAMSSL